MLELKTEIIIDAGAEKIWQILADFKRYPLWNPFVKGILGNLAIGEKLTVQIASPGKKEMTFLPTLVTVKENHEIRWVGKFLLSPLFRGEHYFILEPINDHQTRFIHGEIFSGLLVPLMQKDLRGATYQGFIQMNEALKKELA
jgi:hypothetical protein